MKTTLLLPVFALFILNACKNPERNNPLPPDTPKALQKDDGGSYGFSKRGGYDNDLVQKLYAELSEKTLVLKQLDESIEALPSKGADSVKKFRDYNTQNESYYRKAKEYITSIQDSLLRLRITSLIDSSLGNYHSKIARHTNLEKSIVKKQMSLYDLHIVLKLVKTLPLIEKYQKDAMPSTKPLENLSIDYDALINKTGSQMK